MNPLPDAKVKFTPLFVRRKNLRTGVFWDTEQKGLALAVRPSGQRSFKCVYSFRGRPRWYHIGPADGIDLAVARKEARKVMNAVAEGHDPQAEKKAERRAGTFEDLATRYVEEYAQKHNKSWRQADALVRRWCLPCWAKLPAPAVTRDDVKRLMATIEAPVLANQVVASASAIFTWGIKEKILDENPCRLIDRNETRSRERVLGDSELPLFWAAFDKVGIAGTALKLILLTGQRPGEVAHMRREHIVDGWWEMPGAPNPKFGWPGTKNGQSHRVWLPGVARQLIVRDGDGLVLPGPRGRPIETLDGVMRSICRELGVATKVTPHDLRRTHGTKITGLGFGRDAMNRIQNHKDGGIGSVYDRHGYAEENKRVMETVAAHIAALAENNPEPSNVRMLADKRLAKS